jgi:hypothetical protein
MKNLLFWLDNNPTKQPSEDPCHLYSISPHMPQFQQRAGATALWASTASLLHWPWWYCRCFANASQSKKSAKLFIQSSELGLLQPLARRRVCPPLLRGEGHTRWRERGWESPNSYEGTYTVVLYIYKYFVECMLEKSNFNFDRLQVFLYFLYSKTNFRWMLHVGILFYKSIRAVIF